MDLSCAFKTLDILGGGEGLLLSLLIEINFMEFMYEVLHDSVPAVSFQWRSLIMIQFHDSRLIPTSLQ